MEIKCNVFLIFKTCMWLSLIRYHSFIRSFILGIEIVSHWERSIVRTRRKIAFVIISRIKTLVVSPPSVIS